MELALFDQGWWVRGLLPDLRPVWSIDEWIDPANMRPPNNVEMMPADCE